MVKVGKGWVSCGRGVEGGERQEGEFCDGFEQAVEAPNFVAQEGENAELQF